MSNKLTVVDIAPYLVRGMKALDYNGDCIGVKGINLNESKILVSSSSIFEAYTRVSSVKPLLFPLSCIAEEITVRGETFVPMIKIREPQHWPRAYSEWLDYAINRLKPSSIDCAPHEIAKLLKSWFIDTNDLIGRGLAIDVRTVNPKLYE